MSISLRSVLRAAWAKRGFNGVGGIFPVKLAHLPKEILHLRGEYGLRTGVEGDRLRAYPWPMPGNLVRRLRLSRWG
jgi:hypothetical protein